MGIKSDKGGLGMNSDVNINAMIVDQQVEGIVKDHLDLFPIEKQNDYEWVRSAAFVVLVVKCVLDCTLEEAAECLTDGGGDFAVDAIDIGDPDDGEFDVTIFQGKYKRRLTGDSAYPGNSVLQLVNAVKVLFDPYMDVTLNERLRVRIEEVRSRVKDGLIPNVRVVLCNNGMCWTVEADEAIRRANFPQDQVDIVHFNHDSIVEVLRRTKPIDTTLSLKGAAIVESFNYKRVLVGRLPVTEVARIFDQYDVQLLERNVRRYLGLHSNRVNSAISQTLQDESKRDDFYFFNNGITVVCSKFAHNALQQGDYTVNISDMQIINGGQTCKTIHLTLRDHPELAGKLNKVFVMLRLYELPSDSECFVKDITYATNSQNPVELRDLHANDEIQKNLAIGMESLGYTYRHKRDDEFSGSSSAALFSSITAESVMAVWRHRPHQAKFMRKELFGKFYDIVFNELNAAQAIVANLIFRFVENERKRPSILKKDFLPYSGHYLAMRIGVLLLSTKNIEIRDLTHQNFKEVMEILESEKVNFYKRAIDDVETVLSRFYASRDQLSLQQLSATFRRGDLIEELLKV